MEMFASTFLIKIDKRNTNRTAKFGLVTTSLKRNSRSKWRILERLGILRKPDELLDMICQSTRVADSISLFLFFNGKRVSIGWCTWFTYAYHMNIRVKLHCMWKYCWSTRWDNGAVHTAVEGEEGWMGQRWQTLGSWCQDRPQYRSFQLGPWVAFVGPCHGIPF